MELNPLEGPSRQHLYKPIFLLQLPHVLNKDNYNQQDWIQLA